MTNHDPEYRLSGTLEKPTVLLKGLEGEAFLDYLGREIYPGKGPDYCREQAVRFADTLKLHMAEYGDRPALLLRAPGRLNLFMEYLDMCAGDQMSATIDGDIPLVVSPGDGRDDRVRVGNANPLFPEGSFSISEELGRFREASWAEAEAQGIPDTWEWRSRIHPHHGRAQGDWLNYVVAPFLRLAHAYPDLRLNGCQMTFGRSSIPIRAGTSSSSAMVVLSLLALLHSSSPPLPPLGIRTLCRFLGEAEWYVGTRGGANDQTTIFRGQAGKILYNLHHLDLIDSRPIPWLRGMEVILCNSLWEADKALGARYLFNMRKGWMDLARDLLRLDKRSPEALVHLGWLDPELLGLPAEEIRSLVDGLPAFISTEETGRLLEKDLPSLERDYSLPTAEEGGYQPRAAARFFFEENRIGRSLEALLMEADERLEKGEISVESAAYDTFRKKTAALVNELQVALDHHFQISHPQLDLLIDIARQGPGFQAAKLTGAGGGGCVCVFVEQNAAEEMLDWLDRSYYARPENFANYRNFLDQQAASPEKFVQAKAGELRENLRQALAHPREQRRVVTFSQGAGVLQI